MIPYGPRPPLELADDEAATWDAATPGWIGAWLAARTDIRTDEERP